MVAGLVLLVILTMKLFPDLPATRLLHRTFVELPLLRLAATDRRHLIYAAILVAMLFSGAELIAVLGSADVAMFLAWDISIYVDAVIATWALAAVTRSKAGWQVLGAMVRRPFGSARERRRRRRPAATKQAANDADGDGAGWAYAQAA